MNQDAWGAILVLGLILGIIFFGAKGCDAQNKHELEIEELKIKGGYIQKEYCSRYENKWVKP